MTSRSPCCRGDRRSARWFRPAGRHAAVAGRGAGRVPLPEPLDAAPETAEAFDAGEFVRRIAARVGAAPDQGRRDARAVFATLKEDVAAVDRLRDRLPPDFQDLFE